ncbi:hypothetical protein ACHHYP_07514 [Achlya hypogyna]|uniref:WW domain-containing protein n=1 Tax=Achlya hypogyna TaxID=1202772 RepID=A0A1V9ZLV6_ACHHY|nr:hypothetical protein ACHHYP_07514 [Achlya hypogyna]
MTSNETQQRLEEELAALKVAYQALEVENATLRASLACTDQSQTGGPLLDSLTRETDAVEPAAPHAGTAFGRIKSAVKRPSFWRSEAEATVQTPGGDIDVRYASADTTPRSSLLNYAVASIKGRIRRGSSDQSPEAQEEMTVTGNSNPLPVGWEGKLSRSNGKYYYINKALKITQWERPDASDSETATLRGEKQAMSITQDLSSDSSVMRAPAMDPTDDFHPLAPGWEVKVSRATNKVYYVNKELKETRWERPTVETLLS